MILLQTGETSESAEAVVIFSTRSDYVRLRSGTVPTFHPEYGRFMLESTPGSPYTGNLPDLLKVEEDMRYRYDVPRENLPLLC